MKQKLVLTALALTLAGAIRAQADPVLDWNAIAAQTILAPGARPGPSVVLDFAVVQAAVHEAVQEYNKRFEPYAVDIQNAGVIGRRKTPWTGDTTNLDGLGQACFGWLTTAYWISASSG